VIEVHEDVDLSAYRRGVIRPAYERLLHDVAAGAVDGVLVWKLDRLARRPAQFERFWAACETNRVFLASVTEPVDTSTEIGLAVVRVLVTFAGLESSSNALRLRAKLKEKAEAGLPPSGPRPFGLNATWTEIIPAEADLIREAARRVLAGEGYRHIADDWQARGVLGTRGGAFTSTQVRKLLRSPRLCGDRTWKGDVVAEGCFPAILDRLTFERVQYVMSRRAHGPSPVLRKYLLSGLLSCDGCGKHLHGRNTANAAYACTNCRAVSISARPTEAAVTDLVFEHLLQRRHQRPPRLPEPPRRLLAEYRERLDALNRDYYVTRILTRDEFLTARAAIGAATHVDSTDAEHRADGLPRTFKIRNAETAWPALTLPQRRAVIAAEIDHLTVTKAHRPVHGFDPTRHTPHWRTPTVDLHDRPDGGALDRGRRSQERMACVP
jgi:DNA invertase Pin-like site-specific DNA recombinase